MSFGVKKNLLLGTAENSEKPFFANLNNVGLTNPYYYVGLDFIALGHSNKS